MLGWDILGALNELPLGCEGLHVPLPARQCSAGRGGREGQHCRGMQRSPLQLPAWLAAAAPLV